MKEQIGRSLRNAAAGNARTMEHEISDRMVLFEQIAAQCHDSLTLQEQERMLEQMKAFQELYGYKDMGIATEDSIARSVQGKTYEISEIELFRNAMKGMVTISSTMEDLIGGKNNIRFLLDTARVLQGGRRKKRQFCRWTSTGSG